MLNYVLIVLAKFCFSWTSSQFIEPKEAIDTLEICQYRTDDEFIINNYAVNWKQADYICRHTFNGSLAYFESQDVTDFLTEYLGDSDASLNTLWVNLRKTYSFDHRQWKTWNNKTVEESIFECPYHTPSKLCLNCTDNNDCGAVVRMFHSKLCFVRLHCDAQRKFICRRSITEVSKSTHLDWIKIGPKLFKIFYERLPYDRAAEACTLNDVDSKLAFIETYHEAQTLGRFMLIGRPSKERVWIGARWNYNAYEYEEEVVVLSNRTEASGYPPWLRGQVSKPYGCLLLDRHLSNKTYFVESSCNRFHAYMCYKRFESPAFTEVCLVGDYDWRIYYTAKNWFRAAETCQNSHSTGRLPYIEPQDMKSIIHVMETSEFDVLYHVWLGAYLKNNIWTWTYNNRVLQRRSIEGFPPWVVNKTYNPRIEKGNSCLNLDREDGLEAMFYGTLCYFPQYFICQYDKGSICNNMTTDNIVTTPLTTVTLPNVITTSPLTTAPITGPAEATTPTTTVPSTTTTEKTTTTSIKTKVTAPNLNNGSIFHTTEAIWFKSESDYTTAEYKTTDKVNKYFYYHKALKGESQDKGENSPKSSTRNFLPFRLTTDWPSDENDHKEYYANLDYLIFD